MAISPLDYILQGARKILEKGEDAFRGDIGAVVGNQNLNATKTGIAINTALGLPKAAKDMLLPTRGYSEQQLKQAKPTTKEKLLAIPKIGAEIASIGEVFGGARGLQQFASTDIGGKLADAGDKIRDFAKPKTAGEASAMRIVDVLTLFPVGSLKVTTTGASTIAKTRKLGVIKGVLKKEIPDLADDALEAFGRVLVDVDNVDDVQRVLNRINLQLQKAKPVADDMSLQVKSILETGKPVPTLPPVASKVGSEANPLLYKSAEEFVRKEHGDKFLEAINNTSGAKITQNGFEFDIARFQKEAQHGMPSVREGVFYLPEKNSPYKKYYSTGKHGYGGGDLIEGRTSFINPIISEAGTGGVGIRKAYDKILGKGSYEKMRSDVLDKAISGFNRQTSPEDVAELLTKYNKGTDYSSNYDVAYNIIENSKEGNQLAYAIQENIAGHAVKEAGYDGVISYSKSGGKPRLSEVFDIRTTDYPELGQTDFTYKDFYTENKTKSQLTDIWNKAQGTQTHDIDAIQALREAKGLSAKDIMAKHPDLNLKRDIPVTDIYGNKSVIPEGEALTPYELKGNKVLLQDGETYIVSKNQYANIKGQSKSGEAKEFAPELEGLEETVKGAEYKTEIYNKYVEDLKKKYDPSGIHNMSSLYGELPKAEQVKFKTMKAEQEALRNEATKYSSYTLPGGENYREVLIKAPEQRANITEVPSDWKVEGADGWFDVRNTKGEHIASGKTRNEAIANALKTEGVATYEKQNFRSSHWDEPNVISHIRLNDRTYKGKKVTFMEELQSDWAREGKAKGFATDKLPEGYSIRTVKRDVPGGQVNAYEIIDKNGELLGTGNTKEIAERVAINNLTKGIPFNPFVEKGKWVKPTIKRALKEAVDNNSDYFAWINGEQTSARYNLATYVEDVKWGSKGQMDLGPGSTKTIKLTPKDSANRLEFGIDDNGVIRSVEDGADPTWRGKKLDEVLGKGLADKIMEKETGTLSGEGLKFGGEWANTLYDKQVGNIVKDLTGAKIETLDMGLPIESQKTKWFKTNGVEVRPQDLIVGRELKETKQGNSYIITDILGDGKFKAISKNKIDDPKLYNADRLKSEIDNKDYSRIPESMKETFDISQKTTQQQGIKLTPEIKAKIRGEAPALKKPSGVDILKTIANNYRKNPKLGLSSDDVTKGLKPDSFDKAKKIRQMKTSAEIPSLERTAEMQGVTPVVKPKSPQKQTVKLTPPSQVASPKVTATKPLSTGEERTLEKLAQQQALKANQVSGVEVSSLPKIIQQQTPVSKKVGLLDYIRTPENVLKKIGLEKESKLIRDSYEAYVKELPTNIQKITDWSKRVSKESNRRIFRYLDNQAVDLNPKELKVAGEIKGWLAEWADRLGLPKDNRIAEYITHIFDDQLIKKEFDEDLAKIIADKIPGSVYNPFLEKRLGAKGYIEDTWRALDAYVKRATRKVHMDKALERLEEVSSGLEESQWKYIKRYADRINMRPTEADNLIDNQLKQIIGYKLGQRPVANISRVLRQTTFRGMLGANLGSALRNLTQGVNTYAKLGEKYTAIGYKDLLTKGIKELKDNGILADNLVQDRALSSTKKAIEKLDKGLFFFFDTAEKINRGSAYYGAKAKALAMGKSETGAIEYAKKIVRDTQFQYGAIDTPVAMNSDIVKVLTQFMTYPVKQTEFLAGMAKNKEYMGIARYVLGGLAVVYTVGQVLGMKPTEMIPFFDYASGQRKFGVPPSLKFPIEVIKAGLGAKDQYGQERTIGKKISDVAKTGMGVIPGGIQIKKTYEGAKSVLEGGSYDKSGRKQFEQGESKASQLQSILFGKYAGKNAREYYDEGALSTRAKAKVKPIYDQIQQLKAQGKMDEALTIAQSLSKAEAEVYKSIKSAEKAKQTQELKKKVTPIYNKIQKLKANGQIDEALVIAQSLSEDEIRVYKLIKEADTKRRQLEEVISQ